MPRDLSWILDFEFVEDLQMEFYLNCSQEDLLPKLYIYIYIYIYTSESFVFKFVI